MELLPLAILPKSGQRGTLRAIATRSETQVSDEAAELRREIADLKDQVRVLSDILDEIREQISWVTRNGSPVRRPPPVSPVLKRIAFDPKAANCGDRLQIVRQECEAGDGCVTCCVEFLANHESEEE